MNNELTVIEPRTLALFEELGVMKQLRDKLLAENEGFETWAADDQRRMITFYADNAEKTIEGVKSKFPMVKIRHAGTVAFELPDGSIVREFNAVILDQYSTRAYWETAQDQGGKAGPPDCASSDGVAPYTVRKISPTCVACPKARFGSATKGKGKACRDQRVLVLRVEGNALPLRMQLSAMNLIPLDLYLTALQNSGTPMGTVLTTFKALPAHNKTGTEYTGLGLVKARALTGLEKLTLVKDQIEPYGAQFRTARLEAFDDTHEAPSDAELQRQAEQAKKASEVM